MCQKALCLYFFFSVFYIQLYTFVTLIEINADLIAMSRNEFRIKPGNTTESEWDSIGGYMVAKYRKLEQQFDENAIAGRQLSSIFRGVSIYVTGWTTPSVDELKVIMSKHGGKFHVYYSRYKTTHVIASNLPHAKRKELKPNQKVVKPQWITDCLAAKELLPIEKYLVVPLDNGLQNRITSILEKIPSNESVFETQSNETLIDGTGQRTKIGESSNDENKAPITPKSGGRTICPTTDSNFLSEFYSHSRLHFLSTWKMELTEYVRSLQTKESLKELPLSGYEKLLGVAKIEGAIGNSANFNRVVMHIDMDCFFVSVGLISRPELRGLPVAVTHSTGAGITSERPDTNSEYEKEYYEKKFGQFSSDESSDRTKVPPSSFGPGYSSSEIASCSYEARTAGVKNGMFMGKAKQLCPELRVIPYDFESYRRTSDQLYSTLATYTRHIEAVSCDEALVDITKIVRETGLTPLKVASFIRSDVKEATKCNASTGVGPNIALARMATRRAKPDGQFVVTQCEAKEFMKNLPVKDLPGVGRSTASRLQDMGLSTCGDLQNHPIIDLQKEFGGKTGQKLHDMSCGIDKKEVQIEKERKSVSAEVNYGIRLSGNEEAKTFLHNLSQEVTNRLKSAGMRGRRITLKLMVRRSDAPQESVKFGGHGVCDSWSRSSPILLRHVRGDPYEEDCAAINEAAWSILSSLQLNVSDLRGIGIQITQLQSADSANLSTSESTSAAFLKKFIKRKSDIKNVESDNMDNQNRPSTSGDFLQQNQPPISEPSALDSNEEMKLNSSFLEALPPDLRKEVENNFAQQRQALERNFLINENSNDSNASVEPVVSEMPVTGAPAPNVLFCGGGKLGGVKKQPQKHRIVKGRKGVKTNITKTSTSKPSAQKVRNSDTSPNKLITDMFPVTYSPNKSNLMKKSPKTSPMHNIMGKNTPAAAKVKRRLVTIQEEQNYIEIPDSDEDEITETKKEHQSIEVLPEETENHLPVLGGAFEIQEIRQVLTEWIRSYGETGPLDCDVNDFISFLVRTATDTRDLEKVQLTLQSFHRRLTVIMKTFSNDAAAEPRLEWMKAYKKACDEVQYEIRKSYRGGELRLPTLC
ncbi:DNA repair protein REV1-like isoform X2 [Styela clava]